MSNHYKQHSRRNSIAQGNIQNHRYAEINLDGLSESDLAFSPLNKSPVKIINTVKRSSGIIPKLDTTESQEFFYKKDRSQGLGSERKKKVSLFKIHKVKTFIVYYSIVLLITKNSP